MSQAKDARPVLEKRVLACENERFHVFFDAVTFPGQPQIPRYLVVAPKQSAENLVTGVAVLPIYEGKIGLIKMYRHAIRDDCWEIPRGFIDEGESAELSAVRELEEETGLSCAPEAITPLGFITPDAGVFAARIHLFVATQCTMLRPYNPEEFGHKEFHLLSNAVVNEMILRSEVQDPSTLLAYFRYISIHK